ncbi:sulfotransferase 2B1-like [Zootoca vivipara]|uniref:sulfotransferase 2B1-like n=1 Tax=Zootoca vivipara TaxID=8524 RepID=UPI00293B9049|nr:sulfotransferase 2B1-like [Zootoca vivipara]
MPYFKYKGIPFSTEFFSEETLSYVENDFQLLDDDIVNATYPKLLSTHLPFQLFPKSFLHSKAKVVYTLRNPRETMVSSYHFFKGFKELKDPGTVEEFMERYLSGEIDYGSWFEHVKGWVEMKENYSRCLLDPVLAEGQVETEWPLHCDSSKFHILRASILPNAHCILDLRGSVQKICHFLGKELNSQQIESVVENASFQKMKDNKMSTSSTIPENIFDHTKARLMRKGISGDWKNLLTVAQSERFDRVYWENMRGVNMTFPWD